MTELVPSPTSPPPSLLSSSPRMWLGCSAAIAWGISYAAKPAPTTAVWLTQHGGCVCRLPKHSVMELELGDDNHCEGHPEQPHRTALSTAMSMAYSYMACSLSAACSEQI